MKVDPRFIDPDGVVKGDGEIEQKYRDEIELYHRGTVAAPKAASTAEELSFEDGDAGEPSTALDVQETPGEAGNQRKLGRCANMEIALLEWQCRLRIWYGRSTIQWGVTILILINFVLILIQNSYPFLGQGNVLTKRQIASFDQFTTITDEFFLVIFTLEQ